MLASPPDDKEFLILPLEDLLLVAVDKSAAFDEDVFEELMYPSTGPPAPALWDTEKRFTGAPRAPRPSLFFVV